MKSGKPSPSHGADPGPPAPIGRRTIVTLAATAVLILAILFVVGFWVRHQRIQRREAIARQVKDKPPVVLIVQPKATRKSFELTLPADVRPYAATALYARTAGYLASWKFDINDRVKKGDVMAVISAPDTDAELEQARASLEQQKTNQRLAIITDRRYRGLIPVQGVTQEQLDQFRANREQAGANVASASATVDRLNALVGFEKIIAPFDGVVTVRNYDVGALISASNTAAGQEMFDVEEDDRLRVYVNVPQPYSLMVRFGQPVTLLLARNFPGHKFRGVVARSAGTLDPVTRTLRTELDFENTDPDHRILPGMYGQAIFEIERGEPVLTIPTSALLFEPEGKEVAVVGPGNKVHLQKIAPGTDFGTEMEVLSGLKQNQRIVSNPGEQMAEGIVVAAAPSSGANGSAPKSGKGGP